MIILKFLGNIHEESKFQHHHNNNHGQHNFFLMMMQGICYQLVLHHICSQSLQLVLIILDTIHKQNKFLSHRIDQRQSIDCHLVLNQKYTKQRCLHGLPLLETLQRTQTKHRLPTISYFLNLNNLNLYSKLKYLPL